MLTTRQALTWAKQQLISVTDTPMLEAEVLLAHVLEVSRAHLYAWPETQLTASQSTQFTCATKRRVAGEPVPYITGYGEFWSLELMVTADTLIPRPETELLVECLLAQLGPEARVADLGTGTGAVALALASVCAQWLVCATDNSNAALIVAKCNAQRLGLANIEFRQGDWCGALPVPSRFHALVSNPPYLGEGEWATYAEGLKFEPRSALVSGQDGLDAIQEIIIDGKDYLESGGYVMIEHGFMQGVAVRDLFKASGYQEVVSFRDLGGRERVTSGRYYRPKLLF